MANSQITKIQIPAPNIQTMDVTINGLTPLIFHRWDEKAKLMLLKIQQKSPDAKKREIRDPDQDYLRSFYRNSDGNIAWPVLNVKQAMVDAARNIEGVTMTLLKGAIFTKGDKNGLIQVLVDGKPVSTSGNPVAYPDEEKTNGVIAHDPENSKIEMREDMVRVGMGSADLRYRGQLRDWSMRFDITWNADVLSAAQVLNLLNTAGFACGLGEWRPQCSGDSGTFVVAESKEEAQA